MKVLLLLLIGNFFLFFQQGCHSRDEVKDFTLINLAHLEHLSEEISINNRSIRVVRIYSEYPEYQYVGDDDEGIACVDDVARSAVFYSRYYQYTNDYSVLYKCRGFLEFLKYMQDKNGLFFNFIYSDHSINKIHKNSVSRASWWSWRAIWAFAEAYHMFKESDSAYANDLLKRITYTYPELDSVMQKYPQTFILDGLIMPEWLPYRTAADQAAVLISALELSFKANRDNRIKQYIKKLAEGITTMQLGDSLHFPYGCFLSWENSWHAYGNSQAYALLSTGSTHNNQSYIKRATNEINYFYPFLMANNYFNRLEFSYRKNIYEIVQQLQYPQISYGIRPMVWACLKAFDITGDEKFAKMAGQIGSWLLGNNVTGQLMYDPKTGRCYDGIEDAQNINKNSGAESTIEALLTIQEIEQNPIAKQIFIDFYKNKGN